MSKLATFICSGGQLNISRRKRPLIALIALIHDLDCRLEMDKWLLLATRSTPPATSIEFRKFVMMRYGKDICKATACLWIIALGYKHGPMNKIQAYHDGLSRADVQSDIKDRYIPALRDMEPYETTFTGPNMDVEIPPRLGDQPEIQKVYQDEVCFVTMQQSGKCWGKDGSQAILKTKNLSQAAGGGKPVQKAGRGRSIMASPYICSKHGVFHETLVTLKVGKDNYWTCAMMNALAEKQLQTFTRLYPGERMCGLYDHSMNHKGMATDALVVSKLNKGAGGKTKLPMRDSSYMVASAVDGEPATEVVQSFFFKVGDTLLGPSLTEFLLGPPRAQRAPRQL